MRYESKPLTIYAINNTKILKKSTITQDEGFMWFDQDVYVYEEIRSSLYEKINKCTKLFYSSSHPITQTLNLVTLLPHFFQSCEKPVFSHSLTIRRKTLFSLT